MTTSSSKHDHHHHQQQQQQRLFSESDETRLLKAFRKVSKTSSSTPSCPTSPSSSSSFTITSQHLDLIESSLGFRFSHTQIIDKLRRLKLKYHRQARTKSLIRTPHDLRLHNISRKIWGRKNLPTCYASKRQIVFHPEEEEEEDLSHLTFLREELSRIFPENGVWEKGLECLGGDKIRGFNKEWMVVKREEAQLRARRAELERELIQLVAQPLGSGF